MARSNMAIVTVKMKGVSMQKSKSLIKSLYFVLAVLSSFGAGWFFFEFIAVMNGYEKWIVAVPRGILLSCCIFIAALIYYAGYHVQGKENWGPFNLFLVFILPAFIPIIPVSMIMPIW